MMLDDCAMIRLVAWIARQAAYDANDKNYKKRKGEHSPQAFLKQAGLTERVPDILAIKETIYLSDKDLPWVLQPSFSL